MKNATLAVEALVLAFMAWVAMAQTGYIFGISQFNRPSGSFGLEGRLAFNASQMDLCSQSLWALANAELEHFVQKNNHIYSWFMAVGTAVS